MAVFRLQRRVVSHDQQLAEPKAYHAFNCTAAPNEKPPPSHHPNHHTGRKARRGEPREGLAQGAMVLDTACSHCSHRTLAPGHPCSCFSFAPRYTPKPYLQHSRLRVRAYLLVGKATCRHDWRYVPHFQCSQLEALRESQQPFQRQSHAGWAGTLGGALGTAVKGMAMTSPVLT